VEMAKKGQKIELQTEVKSQDDWERLLSKEGLIVVDAYSKWCGPCTAIVSTFRRIKNELGDDLLHFALAQTDNIDSLTNYRGKSQPTFLFYAGGELVNVIRGCMCPLIIKTIHKELEKEHKVLSGDLDRKVFIDKDAQADRLVTPVEKGDEQKDEDEEVEEIPKQVTVAIIKPDAVQAGLVDDIVKKIEEAGMEVLKMEERTLSKEEAADFYREHEGSEHFDQLTDFMSSGPCVILVVSEGETGENIIPDFRDFIGPKDVNIAKEEAPNSLRALYGTDMVMNAIHGCDGADSSARELAFFFPNYAAPSFKRKKMRLQRTLALIRPDALRARKDSILSKIQESGFQIAMAKEMQMTREQAETFYSEHQGSDHFESLVTNMSSGPMMALCLAREEAVGSWRELLGPKELEELKKEKEELQTEPGDAEDESLAAQELAAEPAPEAGVEEPAKEGEGTEEESKEENKEETSADNEEGTTHAPGVARQLSLRAQFQVDDSPLNPLHGSDSLEQAEKEIGLIFPVQATVAVIKPDAVEEKESIVAKIKEAGFQIISDKEVHLSQEMSSQFYHEHESKEFYGDLTNHMTSGLTTVMVLQKEDAVSEWRSMMGPTDPEEAKEKAPDSIRAQYGKDKLMNAVHGSSNVENASSVIKEFFPDIEFNPDGSIKEAPEVKAEEGGPEEGGPEEAAEEAVAAADGGAEGAEAAAEGAGEATEAAAEGEGKEGEAADEGGETVPTSEESEEKTEPETAEGGDQKPEPGEGADDGAKPEDAAEAPAEATTEEGDTQAAEDSAEKPSTEENKEGTGGEPAAEGESKDSPADAPQEGTDQDTKAEEGGDEEKKTEEATAGDS